MDMGERTTRDTNTQECTAKASERHNFRQNEAIKVIGACEIGDGVYCWAESLETGVVQMLEANELIFGDTEPPNPDYQERYGIENYEPL